MNTFERLEKKKEKKMKRRRIERGGGKKRLEAGSHLNAIGDKRIDLKVSHRKFVLQTGEEPLLH